jgi:hypothetical protein
MSSNGSFSTSNGTSGFLESNSLVSKFAFILLVIFAFVILLRVGIAIISYIFEPNQSPRLINGTVDATQQLIFYQDPSGSVGSSTIYRSKNETDGLEFSWSVWINITNLVYLDGRFRHIFYKGNSSLSPNGLNFPNNAPGLYIAPDTNALVVIMNTFNVINEEVVIPDIPLNKWLNVIIRCENSTLDVYINGTIARSIELHGIPKQNYGDVYVAANGGFQGSIADLWYFNHALGTAEIQKIFENGPNTKVVSSSSTATTDYNDYLSLRWFFYGAGDGYNPSFTKK